MARHIVFLNCKTQPELVMRLEQFEGIRLYDMDFVHVS